MSIIWSVCKVALVTIYFISIFSHGTFGQSWPGLFKRRERPLPIDGSWSSWQEWSSCYENTPLKENFYSPWESFVVQSRKRECDSPAPLYGGEDCLAPPYRYKQCSCQNPLGLSTNRINDSQITSSKHLKDFPPGQVRIGGNNTGWCANEKINFLRKTFIQVDFKGFVNVGAIATQGIKNGRIGRFQLKYSLDGQTWKNIYQENDDKNDIFRGNLIPKKIRKNNFDSHKVMKYLRVFPTETFGLPCLKMEVYGCLFTCGNYLSGSFGEIIAQSSPEFDQNCLWKVEVKNTTSLTFDFNVFYVLCEDGYLDFHDGNTQFYDSKLYRICLADEDQELPLLKINRNSVWINFVSNSSSNEIGFNIKYFSVCSQTISLIEGEEYKFHSPNFPNDYFDNLDCIWTLITPTSTNKVEIKVDSFDIESAVDSNTDCIDDYVAIKYEISNNTKNFGSNYCNKNALPKTFSLDAEKIHVTFKSDSYSIAKGFSMSILSGKKQVVTPKTNKVLSTTFSTTSGNILSKNISDQYTYRKKIKKDSDDTWTVITISAFSAFCLLLLLAVAGTNLKRYIDNRNELNAQCAKMIEAQKEKKSKKQNYLNKQKVKQLYQESKIPTKKVSLPEGNEMSPMLSNGNPYWEENSKDNLKLDLATNHNDSTPNTTGVDFPVDRATKGSTQEINFESSDDRLDTPDVIEEHYSSEDTPDSVDDVDVIDSNSYDSSAPQVHSPLRTDVYLDVKGDESCV